jgi:mannose-1-phosphate guanylyltransferase/phosphomannomutase
MKAVVMAGGEGSRLRPLTVGRPKPMVPIVNKNALAHILDLLKSHGITEVIITLRYMAAAIQDFFGDGSNFGMHIEYSVEETPLGTAGSVKHAAQLLDDTFLVISGDAVVDFDLQAIIDSHKERNAAATLTLYRVPNPLEYGVIVTDDAGHITQFLEKPSWSEVFSDTVNTGLYVLEPEVLALIPETGSYDFSNDLFPQMLAEQMPLFGYVAEGYWCDVGTFSEYMRANADMLLGKVRLSQPIGTHIGGGIWVGRDVEIAPSAQLYGPIYLGNEVKIKGDVVIHGPAVIRDYTIVDNFTRIERSVMWRNTYVGESCELRGAIFCRQCSIKSKVAVYEGVVVGDHCVLDEGCVIHPNVKLWPRKMVEPGATVRESIIWGSQGRRALFSQFGVTGLVNVDLTPEYAAKLGAALGATLPRNSYVAINRDAHRSSRMLKRALISGLPGAGINVWDLGMVPVPVARYFVRNTPQTMAGIHVRLSPFDQRVVDIRFMDAQGMNQSKNNERTIESIFFREDFRRAYLDELGVIEYARQPKERYNEAFLTSVEAARIRDRKFKIVVDYSHGSTADTLADILNKLNVDVVPLNARMDESKLSVLMDDFQAHLRQMGAIVKAVGADLGVMLDVAGEKIFLVDEQGTILTDLQTAALVMELALFRHPDRSVAVPLRLPTSFKIIADWHNGRLIRTKSDLHNLMLTADSENVLLALDGTGNFIFPDFQPSVDGMMATVRLLEYLAYRDLSISHVVNYLPRSHVAQDRVACGWEDKGRVMRLLNRHFADQDIDTTDGIHLPLGEANWVHISPNPERPFFEISAEAEDLAHAEELVAEHLALIQSIIQQNTVDELIEASNGAGGPAADKAAPDTDTDSDVDSDSDTSSGLDAESEPVNA